MLATITNGLVYVLRVGKTYLSTFPNKNILFHLPHLFPFASAKSDKI